MQSLYQPTVAYMVWPVTRTLGRKSTSPAAIGSPMEQVLWKNVSLNMFLNV